MDERKLKDALRTCLMEADFPAERQRAVLQAVRKDESVMKRKLSVALVFAIVITLVVGGAAIAVGFGVFGQAGKDAANGQSAARLARLETEALSVNDTQTVEGQTAPEATAAPQTLYDAILANLYERSFQLTLNQSYCDGNKLYYSYNLSTNAPLAWYEGGAVPTGFDHWDMQESGKYIDHYTQYDEEVQRRYDAFFAEHPIGYIGRESMSLGDGADLNGQPLTILDGGETMVDDCTIQGFQEVELPEGFAPDDPIEIELSVLYGASIYYQDEDTISWAHIATPQNRGILRLPFTVQLNGQAEAYTGEAVTSAYSAKATIFVSDVDISGEVVFDAPKWAEAFEADLLMKLPLISDYALVADGVEYVNLDGAYGVNADGQFFVRVRYDLPENAKEMTLRPKYSGHSSAGNTEHEEIVLAK